MSAGVRSFNLTDKGLLATRAFLFWVRFCVTVKEYGAIVTPVFVTKVFLWGVGLFWLVVTGGMC